MRLIASCALLLLAAPLAVPAQSPEEQALLRAAEQAREGAEAAEAALLAPRGYADGVGALERARRDYRGGAGIAAVETGAERSRVSFESAARTARQAQLTFAEQLAQREAARKAEAFRLAGPDWVKAEELLREAAQRLEKTDVRAALELAAAAGERYGQAELVAVKAAVLTEARSRVVALDAAGTRKLAPRTTARAQELLRSAEAALDADRTRIEEATRLAGQAAAEASHAVALASLLREAREQDRSGEDMVLEWEESLTRAAAAAGLEADLSGGPRPAAQALAGRLGELRQDFEEQAGELRQRDLQVAALEEEIRELDRRLAGVTQESRTLSDRLASRERAREQVTQLEQLFPADQAQVLRQGDDIIVRVHALAFSPGSARLPASARPLIEKLREAAGIYPRARLAIEGHTDSTGDSAANQRLSQARAEAVRDELARALQAPAARITAIGYGASRPVASNESNAGRRQNRRIDLVITPPAEAQP